MSEKLWERGQIGCCWLDHANDDLTVVNAARVSFAKKHSVFDEVKDTSLLRYLWREDHWSPFAHGHLLFMTEVSDSKRLLFMLSRYGTGLRFEQLNPGTSGNSDVYVVAMSLYWALRHWGELSFPMRKVVLTRFPHACSVANRRLLSHMQHGCTFSGFGGDLTGSPSDEYEAVGYQHTLLDTAAGRLATASVHVTAPIFIVRQLQKHIVDLAMSCPIDLAMNEVSRRYVDDNLSFHLPHSWRERPANAKQGSGSDIINILAKPPLRGGPAPGMLQSISIDNEVALYRKFIDHDVAPEQARMLLPQSMMTEYHWTGSLDAFARICRLRSNEHAQVEVRYFADLLSDAMSDALGSKLWEDICIAEFNHNQLLTDQ